ncbi:type I-E CRISPR-associated protein Cas7/Cse4/CasC [Streptomyces nojiriensis]|uniref:type I-E CRISPR-associated protein Cas7/Cse4/CasC n=1 Tax=Streptomyces nojiriensis TaxID=66374 RepID=UPI0035E10AB0
MTTHAIATADLMTGSQYLSLHLLETFVAALPVRDENGMAKELVYGGDTRTMITSQAQNRARRTWTRDRANAGTGHMREHTMGLRTREWAKLTAAALVTRHSWEKDKALQTAKALLSGVGLKFGDKPNTTDLTKVLVYAPQNTAEVLAQFTVDRAAEVTAWVDGWTAEKAAADEATEKKKAAAAAARKAKKNGTPTDIPSASDDAEDKDTKLPTLPASLRAGVLTALAPRDATDIALYGRFLAEIADSPNVDGAIQTGHSFTVHAAQHIDDFYAAADDAKLDRKAHALDFLEAGDDSGAGMTGYQSLITGTFYRHSALDRYKLRANLLAAGMNPDTVAQRAAEAETEFIEAFVEAVPRAKKNSTASTGTLPKLVLSFEGDRPFNYAGVFEKAIDDTDPEPSVTAATRLLDQHALVLRKRGGVSEARVFTLDLDVQQLIDDRVSAGTLPGIEADSLEELTGQ